MWEPSISLTKFCPSVSSRLFATSELQLLEWSVHMPDKTDPKLSRPPLTHLHKARHSRHCWTVSRGSAKVRGAAGSLSAALMGGLDTERKESCITKTNPTKQTRFDLQSAHLASALCSLYGPHPPRDLPFFLDPFLSLSSSSSWKPVLRPQAVHPSPGVTATQEIINGEYQRLN